MTKWVRINLRAHRPITDCLCLAFLPEGVEVELEEEANEERDDSDPERSEQYALFKILHCLILILHFAALRQRRYLIQLLQHSNLRDVLHHFTVNGTLEIMDDDDDDEDDNNRRWMRARRRMRPDPNRFPKVPSDEGRVLMNSGTFGSNDTEVTDPRSRKHVDRRKRLAKRILDRELARDGFAKQRENQRLMAQVSNSETKHLHQNC